MARRTASVAGEGSRWSFVATASRRASQLAGRRTAVGAAVAATGRLTTAGAVATAAVVGDSKPRAKVMPVPTVADQRVHFFKLTPTKGVAAQGRRAVGGVLEQPMCRRPSRNGSARAVLLVPRSAFVRQPLSRTALGVSC